MALPNDAGAGPGPLPAALQPWHPWLRWFAPELAAQLGTLVQRLHPLLGPFHDQPQGGKPEPDGLDDLRQRGPYERLLVTEWLLADEVPEEFLRRAAMGEHLFLAPRPHRRQAERLIVALFDAGPLQLGAPRLAHLALWILLARRALGAGGELCWGVLQAPGELHEARDVQQVLQLLKGRSFVPGDASHWDRWCGALAAGAIQASECWQVGAALLPQAALLPTHQVRVRRGLGGDALEVSVVERRAERAVQLPMPPAPLAVALLTGSFTRAAVIMPEPHCRYERCLSLQRAPVFSRHGDQVAVPLQDEPGVAVFSLPRPREDGKEQVVAPRHQQWAAGPEAVALCVTPRRIVAVLVNAGHLTFWHETGLDARPRPPHEQFHVQAGADTWLPAACLRRGQSQRLYVIDRSSHLVSWQVAGPGEGTLSSVAQSVSGLAHYGPGGLVYVQGQSEHLEVCWLPASGQVSRSVLCRGPAVTQVWFAGGTLWSRGMGGCAVRLGTGPREHWRILQPPDPGGARRPGPMPFDAYERELLPGWQAAGLVRNPQRARFALVALSPDRLQLHRIDERGQELLFAAPSPVQACSVCPNTGRVALLTAQRQLIVYDTAERAVRLVVHSGGAEDSHARA